MRQIILDTETTGLDWKEGNRVVEIGCVEIIDRRQTGRTFHCYLNPERDFEAGAQEVTGLSLAFLADKPLFAEIAADFLAFIDGAELVIHNAKFDVGFLDSELARLPESTCISAHCTVLDTLQLARARFPGQRNSLDALCKRLGVDNSARTLHGALLDAQILADVYIALTSGQEELGFAMHTAQQPATPITAPIAAAAISADSSSRLRVQITAEELDNHLQRVKAISKKSGTDFWQLGLID